MIYNILPFILFALVGKYYLANFICYLIVDFLNCCFFKLLSREIIFFRKMSKIIILAKCLQNNKLLDSIYKPIRFYQ